MIPNSFQFYNTDKGGQSIMLEHLKAGSKIIFYLFNVNFSQNVIVRGRKVDLSNAVLIGVFEK
jgi:hypothetical protein